MKRRDFVQRLPVLTAGLAAVTSATSLTGCAGAPYLVPALGPRGLVMNVTDLGPDGDAFLQTPEMERPIYVRRLESGALSAVLASCTHRGCQPEPLGDRLSCPCHGSEFSFVGAVLSGPADEPLARYDVVEAEGQIMVRVPGGAS